MKNITRKLSLQACCLIALGVGLAATLSQFAHTSTRSRTPSSLPANYTLSAAQLNSAFRGAATAWKINSTQDLRAQGQILRFYQLSATNPDLFSSNPQQAQQLIEQAGEDYANVFSANTPSDGRQPQSLPKKRRKLASKSTQESLKDLGVWLPSIYAASAGIVSAGTLAISAVPGALAGGLLAGGMAIAGFIQGAISQTAPAPMSVTDAHKMRSQFNEKIELLSQKISQTCDANPKAASIYDATVGQRTGISSQSSLSEITATSPELLHQPALASLAKAVTPEGTLHLDAQQINDAIKQSFKDASFLGEPEKQTLLNEAKSAAEDRSKAAEREQERFRTEGAYASVNVTSTLIGFINPELGNQISAVGSGVVKANKSIIELRRGFSGSSAGIDHLFSSAIFMQDVLSIGMQIFSLFRHPGPTPEQVILDEVRNLKKQLADIREDMHERFDQIDLQMNDIYKTMLDNFESLSDEISNANRKLDRIEISLTNLNLSLDRLENRIHDYMQALADRNFDAETADCFHYWGQKSITLENYRTCINLFALKAVGYSQDALAVSAPSPTEAQTFPLIPDDLENHPDRYLGFLARISYFAPQLNNSLVTLTRFTPYLSLNNPVEWAIGAQNFVQMARSQTGYLPQIPSSTIDQIISRGELISDFLRALTHTPSSQGPQAQRDVIDNLLAVYTKSQAKFINAWKSWRSSSFKAFELPDGVDPFLGADHLPQDVRAQRANSSVSKCNDTNLYEVATQRYADDSWRPLLQGGQEDDRYQGLPDKYKANDLHKSLNFILSAHPQFSPMIPRRFRQAEFLNLGQIKYCWSNIEWNQTQPTEVYYSSSREDVEPGDPHALDQAKFSALQNCVNSHLKDNLYPPPPGGGRRQTWQAICNWKEIDSWCDNRPCLKFRRHEVYRGELAITIRATFESRNGSLPIGTFRFASSNKNIYFRRNSEEQGAPISNYQLQAASARGSAFAAFPIFYQEALSTTNWPSGYPIVNTDDAALERASLGILPAINDKLNLARDNYSRELKNSLVSNENLKSSAQQMDGAKRLVETVLALAMPQTLNKDDRLRSLLYGVSALPSSNSLIQAAASSLSFDQQENILNASDPSHELSLKKYLDTYFTVSPQPNEGYPFIDATIQSLTDLKTEQIKAKNNRIQIRAALSRLQGRVRELTGLK